MHKKIKQKTLFIILIILSINILGKASIPVQAAGCFAPLNWQVSFDTPTTPQFRTITEYNGMLYAAGHNNPQTNGELYRFDGTSWQDMDFNVQVGATVDMIEYLYVFNNRLYIGARTSSSGNCYARVYYYDGVNFTLDISRNGACGYSGIESFTTHNGDLYAANGSPLGEVYQRISDSNWITVGSTIEVGSPARALASYNGSLYAGTGASGDNARVWRWSGSNWVLVVDFKTDFGTTHDGVISLATVNGMLFAGTVGPGSTSYVFSYDETTWTKSFELSGCASTRLSVIGSILWAGFALPGATTCYGQVYRLENETWVDSGNLGDAAQSDFTFFTEYQGSIYGATLSNGKIYYATFDNAPPSVISTSLQTSYTTGPFSFKVIFSEDVSNSGGGTLTDDVTNINNFKIINKGENDTVETVSCASSIGGDDSLITPNSVTYAPNTATVNLGSALPIGSYRLFVCGTTSITDLVGNPLNGGTDFTFDFIVGSSPSTATFGDVPVDYWAWQYIEAIYGAGITGGCSTAPMNYCPTDTVTRAQMAVFLLRGMHGKGYIPPAVTGAVFTDVPADHWAGKWIEQLSAEGITSGCGDGNYCPDANVTRAEMAIFLLRARYGKDYVPPAASGLFNDVPTDYWAAAWIEQLAVESITGGCGNGNYCPKQAITRAEMAVFLVRAFNLPLP